MPTHDDFNPNAPAIPDELRERIFTKPAHALGEPTKALENALRGNATLRARIAELEARLALADKVCEAAANQCRKIHELVMFSGVVVGAAAVFAAAEDTETALAAWKAQKT